MGATVLAYWPGITEAEIEEQPGFFNDYGGWAHWRVAVEQQPAVRQFLVDLGVGALLTLTTEGMSAAMVQWVSPRSLREAAQRLQMLVQARHRGVDRVLDLYADHAAGVDPLDMEFLQDLRDVESLARWAEEKEVTHMTLEVNW